MTKRPVLVVGCGSIGRRHIENLQNLGHRVVAYDPDPDRAAWVRKNLGCATSASLEQGLAENPLACWVCTPPHRHASVAESSFALGTPCFIEKPLTPDAASARALLRSARRRRVRAAVGYQLRNHPALVWIKHRMERKTWGSLLYLRAHLGQYLPDWRPWQDYRKSYTARRAMGGGILLDGSHEIDLTLWLAGDAASVFCTARRLSHLQIDVEDTASLQLEFRSGAFGEVHLDMISRAYRRGLELSFEEGTVVWDQPSSELRVYSPRSRRWTTRRFAVDSNSLYVREASEFLRLAAGRPSQSVSLEDGLRTLTVAEAAARSASSRRMERIRP